MQNNSVTICVSQPLMFHVLQIKELFIMHFFSLVFPAWHDGPMRYQVLSFPGFRNLIDRHLVGLLGRGISTSQSLSLQKTRKKHKKKRIQASMPILEFEPTILVFEQQQTVNPINREANVIGAYYVYALSTGSFNIWSAHRLYFGFMHMFKR